MTKRESRERYIENEDGHSAVRYVTMLGPNILTTTSELGGLGPWMHNLYVIISGAMPTPEQFVIAWRADCSST